MPSVEISREKWNAMCRVSAVTYISWLRSIVLLHRPKERRVGFSLFFCWACAICTAFFSHPLTNRLSTVWELQWVFRLKISQLCRHVCRSCVPGTVLLANFQIFFFLQSEREGKKSCSFTATLIRTSVCHFFQHDVVFGLTERDKYLLTSLPIQCSVFWKVTQLYVI